MYKYITMETAKQTKDSKWQAHKREIVLFAHVTFGQWGFSPTQEYDKTQLSNAHSLSFSYWQLAGDFSARMILGPLELFAPKFEKLLHENACKETKIFPFPSLLRVSFEHALHALLRKVV